MTSTRGGRLLLPAAAAVVSALLLLLVDPLLAGAPWWSPAGAGLRGAMLPALLAAAALDAALLLIAALRPTRTVCVLGAVGILGAALLPAVAGSVLVIAVFPGAHPLWISVVLGAAATTWVVLSVARCAWRGARPARAEVTRTARKANAS